MDWRLRGFKRGYRLKNLLRDLNGIEASCHKPDLIECTEIHPPLHRPPWKAPELFNDPFEFKSPFEFGFEWEELESPLLDEMSRLVTRPEQPELLEDGPTTSQIRNWRIAYAASRQSPGDLRPEFEGVVASIIKRLRKDDYGYDQLWRRFKRQYRVLCFSAVANNILMWSHYAHSHTGAVLAFEPRQRWRWECSYTVFGRDSLP